MAIDVPVFKFNRDAAIPDFRDSGVSQNLIFSEKKDPNQVADDMATSSGLGVSLSTIGPENRKQLKRDNEKNTIENKLTNSPQLHSFIETDVDFASIIRDDIDNSIKSEGIGRDFSDRGRFSTGVDILEGMGWRFIESILEFTEEEEELERKAARRAKEIFENVAPAPRIEDVDSADRLYDWLVSNGVQQIPLMAPGLVGSIIGTGIGSFVGSIVPGVGTVIGGIIGNRVGAFIPSFILGMGEVQQSIRDIDPDIERPFVTLTGGAIIGALDSLLPGKIGRRLVGMFGLDVTQEILRRTTKEMLKRAAIEGGKGLTIEGITEGLQTAVETSLAAFATDTDVDIPRLASDMLNSFAVGALMGGTIGTATSPVADHMQARRFEKNMKALNKVAKDSKLRERNKEMFGQVTGQYIRNGGVNQFVVNTDMLLWWAEQQPDPDILRLLEVGDQLDNAEVVLTPETFSAYVLGVDGYEQLIKFVRTVDGRSVESTTTEFSNLEIVEAMSLKLGEFPISDELKEKTLKTLEEFRTKDALEVFENLAPEVEPILNALYAEVTQDVLDTTDLQLEGRLRQLDAEIEVVTNEIAALEKKLEVAEKAKRGTKRIEIALNAALTKLDGLVDQQLKINVPGEGVFGQEEVEIEERPEQPTQVKEVSSKFKGLARKIREEDNPDLVREVVKSHDESAGILSELKGPNAAATEGETASVRKQIYDVTQQALSDFPEVMVVYRVGGLRGGEPVSFTVNPNFRFKLNLPWVTDENAKLQAYSVNKADILAAPNAVLRPGKGTAQEHEVIIPGTAVTAISDTEAGTSVRQDLATAQRKKPIKLKGKALQDLEVETTQREIRDIRKGMAAGLTVGKNLNQSKKAVVKAIKKAPISDAQKIIQIGRINAVDTVGQFNKLLPRVRARIDNLMTTGHRKAIKDAIKEQTKGTKATGKEGDFDADVQVYLDDIRFILGLNHKTLRERQDVQERLDAQIETIEPNPDEAYKAMLYGLLLDDPTVELAEAENFLIDLAKLKAQGKLASMVRRNTRKLKIERGVAEAKEAVLAGKNPRMINTSTLSARARLKIQAAGNIKDSMIMAWSDILDIAFNKEGVDAEALIESLTISDEIGNWKADNVKWETRLLDTYREIYGLKDNNAALNRMMDDSKVHSLGVFQDKNEETVDLQYSVAEIRNLYMERQDPTLRKIFEEKTGNAYTEQMFSAIWGRLDNEDKDTNFALAQLEIYREFYKDINKVYRRMYGVNLPFNEFYSPIKRDKTVEKEGVEGAFGGEEILVNEYKLRRSISKSLIKRKKNELALGKQNDFAVMYQHIHNMNWFIHTAEKVLHIKNVFKDEALKQAIVLQHGDGMLRNINSFIEDFSVGHIKKGDEFNKFISNVNSRFAESVLALKPTIGIKQLTSWFAMADGMPAKDFMKWNIDFLKNPEKVIKFLYENAPGLPTRGNSLEFELARLGKTEKNVFNIKGQAKWRDIEFMFIRWGDRLPIYAGGWAVYQHAVANGKTHKQAIKIFERTFNDTQQSTDIDKLSSLQRNTAIGRTLTMFMTARLALIRGEMRAWRQSPLPLIGRNKISWFDFGKRIGYYHFIMPTLIQWIASGFNWDEDKQAAAAILGQFNSLVILGDFMYFTIMEIIADDKNFAVDTDLPLVDIVNEALRGVFSLKEADWESEEMIDAFRDIGSVVGKMTGKPIEQVMNWMGGVGNIEDDEIAKGILRFVGYSESIAGEAADEFEDLF